MAEIKCQESYDAGYDEGHKDGLKEGDDGAAYEYDRGYDDGKDEGYHDGYEDGTTKGPFDNSQKDDLRFTVRAIKAGDGEQAIFSLCRALGNDTEAAEVVLNEWRRK